MTSTSRPVIEPGTVGPGPPCPQAPPTNPAHRQGCNVTVTFNGSTGTATLLGAWAGVWLIDALIRPRARRFPMLPMVRRLPMLRSLPGLALLAAMASALYGGFLALTGNGAVAMALTLALQGLFAVASNAKHAMLGEPLLFSDLALVGALFRHPQFYLSAVRVWQRVAVGLAALALVGAIAWLSRADPAAHLAGLILLAGGLAALRLARGWSRSAACSLARVPDAAGDVRALGLIPTILLYWWRWQDEADPAPCPLPPRAAPATPPELVVVIQCESFADPRDLFGARGEALPALEAARTAAFQWGNLEVSGFGAYTMRTEYGVLFGREEEALGFRRYDPFLTALGEASYALPARLPGWHARFVHPHDMRFYGRDAIMPAGGFAELVGEEHFAPPGPGEGRYVTDAAMTEVILDLAARTPGPDLLPGLLYAVTIENHGPWAPDARGGGKPDLVEGYMRLVRHGDAMLAALREGLAALRRPALLVFFGDHRPSIPGASVPPPEGAQGRRHTPYVMLQIGADGQTITGENRRVDLSPAGLHHAVLDAVLGPVPGPVPGPAPEPAPGME